MVVRGWGGAVATALGAAAAAGAAQLGLGYGMDIINYPAVTGDGGSEVWRASLTWAAWITATSTILGAVIAERLSADPQPLPASRRAPADPLAAAPDRPGSQRWRRLALAASAAAGAAATAVLVAVPARVADLADTSSPQLAAGGYALLGALLGLLIAAGALAARAVAANLLATAGWLWLLAAATVTDGVVAGRDWTWVPLAFWEFGAGGAWFSSIWLPDAAVALAAALLLGALAAAPAARRGDHPAGVVISGAAGPLVVAAAYLLTQPDLVSAGAVELSRHLIAPYLVVAGLLGSLLGSAVPQRRTADPEAEAESESAQADLADDSATTDSPVRKAPGPRTESKEALSEQV